MKTTIPKVPFEGFEQDNDHDRAEFFRQKNKEHFGGLMECAKEAQTLKTERDAALARAEAAEAEIRAIREEVRADPAAKTVDAVAALLASARCSVEEAQREAERLRHGTPIESDMVCPNELRATEAERERDEARAELLPCCVCGSRQPCEHDEQAEREEQKVHHG